jgi:hypothetical protein
LVIPELPKMVKAPLIQNKKYLEELEVTKKNLTSYLDFLLKDVRMTRNKYLIEFLKLDTFDIEEY